MIIPQKAELEIFDPVQAMKKLEKIGRVCYRSEDKITEESYKGFLRGLISRGHESVLEHVSVTAYLTVNRAIAQEITRHRIGSYTHESTRYVKYDDVELIPSFDRPDMADWLDSIYNGLLEQGVPKELARDALPLCTASRLVVTYNLRQWRHFFRLRYAGSTGRPHPQIQELAGMLFEQFYEQMPILFEDIKKEVDSKNSV
jgi:thymidylate synthase (FAD)